MTTPTLFQSASAAIRLAEAGRFIESCPRSEEILCVASTRSAADDVVRDLARRRTATFGLHRFSLTSFIVRIAANRLARQGFAPATRLGLEAVAARVSFEAVSADTLAYFKPVVAYRGFARALADTVGDLRLAGVEPAALARLEPAGNDLEDLARRFDGQLTDAHLADRSTLCRLAVETIQEGDAALELGRPLLLLDVPITAATERDLVVALAAVSPRMLITVPVGDDRTTDLLNELVDVAYADTEHAEETAIGRARGYLFAVDVPESEAPIDRTEDSSVTLFSAPGEGRECVEIARRALEEAARGVPFDDMAILLREPRRYAGLLDSALRRAGVGAWFARGTSTPDPSGRAFLALLRCATERLSARHFSEYLSLGQVPALGAAGEPPDIAGAWVVPDDEDEVLAPVVEASGRPEPEGRPPESSDAPDSDEQPVLAGTLRAPWQWDRLIVESAVIGGRNRWTRRLDGLAHELKLKREACASDEAESPKLVAIDRDLRNLRHLRGFALPVIDALASLPESGVWGDWLPALERLALMVLRRPDRVLGILAELHPMSGVGPVTLEEVAGVLSDRLALLQREPPALRYGRVFVGAPDQARGRTFRVIFVPGLAERMFPQKPREDPILLDAARAQLDSTLRTQEARGQHERLLLRIAAGAASERLYLSYPRIDVADARPRVPSFYALDVERAVTGRVPDFEQLERDAFARAEARLAWPAPGDPSRAVDDTEHDLAVLGGLLRSRDLGKTKGRARYLLEVNSHLRRSLRTRWARWQKGWSGYDGLYARSDAARRALSRHRLSARPYSVSALQKFAACPYQFLLSAIYRLEPRKEAVPLEQMDPLIRGQLFHRVQAELFHDLKTRGALPIVAARLQEATQAVDAVLDRVAADSHEELAPAIDRVWRDEIDGLRADLRGWLVRVAEDDGAWEPRYAEFGFGFPPADGRDPNSVPDPVTLDGGWQLHGVVDLVEQRRGGKELRVTDHKTGVNRTKPDLVIGGGELLQPVLYGLAIERTLGAPVVESRLSFCTAKGGFTHQVVPLAAEALNRARRRGIEVLEIVDRAVDEGFLVPAPRQGACRYCDFREVCGPWEETRVKKKNQGKLADLLELRKMP